MLSCSMNFYAFNLKGSSAVNLVSSVEFLQYNILFIYVQTALLRRSWKRSTKVNNSFLSGTPHNIDIKSQTCPSLWQCIVPWPPPFWFNFFFFTAMLCCGFLCRSFLCMLLCLSSTTRYHSLPLCSSHNACVFLWSGVCDRVSDSGGCAHRERWDGSCISDGFDTWCRTPDMQILCCLSLIQFLIRRSSLCACTLYPPFTPSALPLPPTTRSYLIPWPTLSRGFKYVFFFLFRSM